jgi:carbamoyltransferase
MNIIGLSYMYHDSAACLVRDGEVIAACEEERFNRIKHSIEFPHRSVDFCLREGRLKINEIDAIVFYEKPLQKFERILKTYIGTFPFSYRSFRQFLPLWLKHKLFIPQTIKEELNYKGQIYFVDHHYAHAASAFYPSGFEEAAILTADGTGEWTTLSCGVGTGNKITMSKEMRFPHSIGLLYSAVTAYLGFQVNGGEGKVMALASYGEPAYYNEFRKIIKIKDDGSFWLNMDYFAFHSDLVMTSKKFAHTFGSSRIPGSELKSEHYDMAATLQKITEEALISIARQLFCETRISNLCMAGGVALNCVSNHKILENSDFKDIFIQPAAGDDGGSLGSALYVDIVMSNRAKRWRMKNAYLGPSFSTEEIEALLQEWGVSYHKYRNRSELRDFIAKALLDNKIIGYFQGRMEFGPRALGARSIFANPANRDMKDILNNTVKHREWFRPFAPAVLYEFKDDYFELLADSPFMLLSARVKKEVRDRIPAVIHIDCTSRVQTVKKEDNPEFYELISEFHKLSGIPMVLNTSFNDKGEPMVCSPIDAYLCFINMRIDYLVLENLLVSRLDLDLAEH